MLGTAVGGQGIHKPASTNLGSGARVRDRRSAAIAMRLAVLIRPVGDVRRGGDRPDRAAS
jgi:hypothetical protein